MGHKIQLKYILRHQELLISSLKTLSSIFHMFNTSCSITAMTPSHKECWAPVKPTERICSRERSMSVLDTVIRSSASKTSPLTTKQPGSECEENLHPQCRGATEQAISFLWSETNWAVRWGEDQQWIRCRTRSTLPTRPDGCGARSLTQFSSIIPMLYLSSPRRSGCSCCCSA